MKPWCSPRKGLSWFPVGLASGVWMSLQSRPWLGGKASSPFLSLYWSVVGIAPFTGIQGDFQLAQCQRVDRWRRHMAAFLRDGAYSFHSWRGVWCPLYLPGGGSFARNVSVRRRALKPGQWVVSWVTGPLFVASWEHHGVWMEWGLGGYHGRWDPKDEAFLAG